MRVALTILGAAALIAGPAAAAEPISLQDSFRIGTVGNILCSAQMMTAGKAFTDMFDRGYSIVCRDAAVPVGQLYALRERGGDPAGRLAGLRAEKVQCQPAASEQVQDLGAVEVQACRLADADVAYSVLAKRQNGTLFVAEGLAGYESALRLGLRSLVSDRLAPGEVSVATTGIGDPASFARVQAGSLTPERALAEAYRRNNSGNYAEAAEFFGTLSTDAGAAPSRTEALANEAVQRSNLGAYAEAELLFAQADPQARGDAILERQLRNFRAMHLLNQGKLGEAEAELARPVAEVDASANAALQQLVIDADTANQLSSETPGSRRLGGESGLTPQDKIKILDAQSLQLRGALLRLRGKPAEATVALRQAESQLLVVRDGRVAATHWMRSQILADLADIAEASGNAGEAEALLQSATGLVETYYPGSLALLGTKGRLASFYARNGRADEALTTFRAIVDANSEVGSASPALRRIIGTYFDLLLQQPDSGATAAEMFRASQLLVRPGLAQTQAILARELSGGSDEAALLFRQAVSLNREAERLRVERGRLRQQGIDANRQGLDEIEASLARVEQDQVANQSALSAFPRYRAISNAALALPALQAQLRPGEAYYKMVALPGQAFAIFAGPKDARAFRLGMTPQELDYQVDNIRATISTVENGEIITLPYDVEGAHRLYRALFDPLGTKLAGVRHLVFEPDGAMLRLPPNLLVMDPASVETYRARAARPGDDGFDLRDIAWLGRERDISTAVSPRAFTELRQSAPSRARAQYIGFGEHKPTNAFFLPAGGTRGAASDACQWSFAAWGRPISAGELLTARQALGASGTEVITGQSFTDTGITARSDLDQYRIVHFATHGLVAPPRPECPARPALMTSFGGEGSDGLLSFGEIFDLRLDADVIILSACDTAGRASIAANREAGITSGGDFALDGLVRAFVGAGGRLVVASHWPVPDDFDATQRLMSGLFTSPSGTGTAAALRHAQRALMDDVTTSHPFYWAGFAVVGDGELPLIRPATVQTAAR